MRCFSRTVLTLLLVAAGCLPGTSRGEGGQAVPILRRDSVAGTTEGGTRSIMLPERPAPVRYLGLPPRTDEERHRAEEQRVDARAVVARRDGPLPGRVVNVEYLPAVGRQLLGSCTSWAVCYYMKGWQEAKENGWVRPADPDKVPSPAMPYNMLALDGGSGISFTGALDFITNHGTCTFGEFPETPDLSVAPSAEQWKSAARWRGSGWSTFNASAEDGLLALKTVLADGEVVAGFLAVRQNVDEYPGSPTTVEDGVDNGVLFAEVGDLRGLHAVCFVGYDDDITYNDGTGEKRGAFLLVNSWGPWGVSVPEADSLGFMWLAYDFMETRPGYGGHDPMQFYLLHDRIGYEPRTFAVIDFQHACRIEAQMTLYTGQWTLPSWSQQAVMMSGLRDIDTTVAVDVTDAFPAMPYAMGLRVVDLDLPQYEGDPAGVVRSFHVEDTSGVRIEAEGLPAAMPRMEDNRYGDRYVAVPLTQGGQYFDMTAASTAAAADVDGDGDIDLVINGEVFLNDGEGRFNARGRPLIRHVPVRGGEGAALGDYDRDGFPDLAVATYNEPLEELEIVVFRNIGGGRFSELLERIPMGWRSCTRLYWMDWDGDGWLDIVTPEAVLLGNGLGQWRDAGVSLPPAPAWGSQPVDVDGDGLLDIGWFLQQPDGSFVEAPIEDGEFRLLTVRGYAMGDFDADGDMDMVLAGTEDSGSGSRATTRVYEFDAGAFHLVRTGLPPVKEDPNFVWADMNADGLLDIVYNGTDVMSGYYTTWTPRMHVVVQEAPGVFEAADGPYEALGQGQLLVADFDGDGDLDIYYSGSSLVDSDHPFFSWKAGLVESTLSVAGVALNEAPAPPGGLVAEVLGGTGSAVLRWEPAVDDLTPAANMRYRLQVGSRPGATDGFSVAAPLDLGACRLDDSTTGYRVHRLPAGEWYGSVQAIDAGGQASGWSDPHAFNVAVSPYTFRGDMNGDNVVDVSDLAVLARMEAGGLPEDLDRGDLDSDGQISGNDVLVLEDLVVEREGPLPEGFAYIGAEGGTLSVDGFELSVPAGAFSQRRLLHVFQGIDGSFGSLELPASYFVRGVPADYRQPLEVTLRDTRTYYITDPLAVLTESGYSRSVNRVEDCHEIMEPVRIIGEYGEEQHFVFRIDAPPLEGAGRADYSGDGAGDFEFGIGVLGGYYNYVTPHFDICFPAALDSENVEKLGRDLEDAWDRFQQADLGFSYARRTRWPVSVTVKDGLGQTNGYQTNSARGINYGAITLNSGIMANDELRRATAAHEFFHIVQSFYDPRNRFSMAWKAGPHLWLDEAASSWAEELFVGTPGAYIPSTTNSSMTLPFPTIPPKPGANTGQVADHGYALASVVRYLQESTTYGGAGTLHRIYDYVRRGYDPVDALENGAKYSGFLWLDAYYARMLEGNVYPFDRDAMIGSIAPNRNSLRVDSDAARTAVFAGENFRLGSTTYRAYKVPGYTGLDSGESLVVGMRGTEKCNLQVFGFKGDERPRLVGNARPATDDEPAYVEVGGALETLGAGNVYLAMVTTRDPGAEPDEKTPHVLAIGLPWGGDVDLGTWTVPTFYSGVTSKSDFPVFTVDGASFRTGAFSEEMRFLMDGTSGVLIVAGSAWGPWPRTLEVQLPVELSSGYMDFDWYGDSVTVETVFSGVEMVRSYTIAGSPVSETVGSSGVGDFEFEMSREDADSTFQFNVLYTVTETITPKAGEPQVSTRSYWHPVLAVALWPDL